jgi:type I restriction enzyme, S subunit
VSLPTIWPTERAKWLLMRQSRPPRAEDNVVTAFRDGQVTLRANRRLDGFTEAIQEIGYQGIRKGDLVVHSMDGFAGAIGVSDSDGKSSPVVHAYTVDKGSDPRFIAYTLRTMAASKYIESLAKGIRERSTSFDAGTLADLQLPCPPVGEQQRIADFLDVETTRIDAVISNRATQSTILNELELARISIQLSGEDFQTQKFSPWPWLPPIPDSWSIGPVYAYYDVQLGKMLNAERASGNGQHPYLRNANVHWYEIDTEDMSSMVFTPDEYARYRIHEGDLLVCEGGAGVAEAAVWDGRIGDCFYQKSLHRVRSRTDVPVEWLMYWLRLAKSVGVFEADGNIATIPHLTGEQLAEYRIPIPPDGPHRVKELRSEITAIRETQARLTEANALLLERKQALITAAVTGQIDVTTARGGVT